MNRVNALRLSLAGLLALLPAVATGPVHAQQQSPTGQIPDAGVPQVVRTEGKYVRSAYNNEGYVIVGYQMANISIGEEWMLLEVGTTVREGVQEFTRTRDALSLVTPGGTRIPLSSVEEFRKANLQALDARADIIRDSINYFPSTALKPCWIGFFSDQASRTLSWDQVVVSSSQACRGRIYFRVPGGIKPGPHSLDVQFQKSIVRVPFTIAKPSAS